MAAAVGYGTYASLPQASDAMVKIVKTITPDKKRHERYMEFYQRYKKLYGLYQSLEMIQ